jgi:Flp pilus assembly protein TadD
MQGQSGRPLAIAPGSNLSEGSMRRVPNCRRPSLTLAGLVSCGLLAGCATARGRATTDASVTAIPDVAANARLPEILARAESAWNAGSYPLATNLYAVAVARDSSSSRAVFRLATLNAWNDDRHTAERLFRRYITLEPQDTEGRLALARALAWGANYSSAIAIYDSVIAGDKTYRDAVVGRAQTLTWQGRADEGLLAYREWTAEHPTDREALVEYARALSWSGRLDEATAVYAPLAGAGNADAQKGLARVAAWRGELTQSLDAWDRVILTRPKDAEALTGRAQVLHWMGRDSDADAALRAALAINPGYGDARVLLRWVDAELHPVVTMGSSGTDDSDHNRVTIAQLGYETAAGHQTRVGARFSGKSAHLGSTDSRADALGAFARWQPGTWWLRADGGVTRHSSTLVPSPSRPRTIASVGLHASGILARTLTINVDAARSPFDETALLIANGVVSSELAADAELVLPGQFSLSGAASGARLTGGAHDNTRRALSSALRWNYNRRWSVALGARRFGYDTASADGYFSPRRYTLAELSGRGRVGADLGWNGDADVGVGRQSIEFFGSSAGSRLAERVALTAGYRFDPAREVTLTGRYANVAAPGQTGGSEYRIYTIGLAARLGL